jgi:membrane protease YdiL (CAAX protease family)
VTTVEHPTRATSQYRESFFAVLIGFVLLFLLLDRTPSLVASHDRTVGFLVASSVLVVVAVSLDMLLFRRTLPSTWRTLGFGRPELRTLVITTLIGALMLGFFPVFSWATRASFALPEDWVWILLGLFAVHGIAEEVLFRGFAFHNLRFGRTFGRAAWLSLLLFAIAHLYLLTYMPPILALFATFLSLASAHPLAYLFERCNNTIWAPAVLHTQVHAISFFVIPEAFVVTAAIACMTMWSLSVLLIYAFRKRLFSHNRAA